MKNSNFDHVKSLNKMWNTFDSSHISDLIAEHIHYESFWVLRPLDGREQFLDYIDLKLRTIKDAVDRGDIVLQSFVGQVDGLPDEYYLILHHTIRGKNWESLIRVTIEDGLIVKMSIEPLKKRFNINIIQDTELLEN